MTQAEKVLDDATWNKLQRIVSTVLKNANRIDIDLTAVERDIGKFNNSIKKIFVNIEIKDIGGEEDLKETRILLKHCIKIRAKLVHRKVVLKKALLIWSHVLDQGTFLLRQQTDIALLKNEALRDSHIKMLMQPVWDNNFLAKGLLDNLDTLIWAITNNQKALEIQVSSWKEELWAERGT